MYAILADLLEVLPSATYYKRQASYLLDTPSLRIPENFAYCPPLDYYFHANQLL